MPGQPMDYGGKVPAGATDKPAVTLGPPNPLPTEVGQEKKPVKNLDRADIFNNVMVESGFAVAYVRYSKKYLQSEKKAKNLKKGMWAGEFDRPEDWRRKYN